MKSFAALLLLLVSLSAQGTAQVFLFEGEDRQLVGTHFADSVSGYSGSGYVTGFDDAMGGTTSSVR